MISPITLSEEAITSPRWWALTIVESPLHPGRELEIPQREALVAPWLPRGQVLAVGDGFGAPHAHAVSTRLGRKHRLHAGVLERGAHEALRMEAPAGFREINSPSPRVRPRQLGDARCEVQSHTERRGGGGPARGDRRIVAGSSPTSRRRGQRPRQPILAWLEKPAPYSKCSLERL